MILFSNNWVAIKFAVNGHDLLRDSFFSLLSDPIPASDQYTVSHNLVGRLQNYNHH